MTEVKPKYKYFGNGKCETKSAVFKKFGQELPLTDLTAADMIDAGAGLLRSEDFDLIGFTPTEMADRRERQGPAYMARHAEALLKMRALREDLRDSLAAAAAERG